MTVMRKIRAKLHTRPPEKDLPTGTIILELCSAASVPEVRYCDVDEFCCGNGCCPRSMLYFFKLSVAVVLIVMILVWLCNYMRRGRSQQHEVPEGLRVQHPRSLVPPPPPYSAQTRAQAQQTHLPFPAQPAQPAQQPTPQPQDDLPPPYHTVVSMPPSGIVSTHLPSYDASCKVMNGPA